MLPILIESYLNIISSYNLIRQTIPMVYNSIGEIKLVDLLATGILFVRLSVRLSVRHTPVLCPDE